MEHLDFTTPRPLLDAIAAGWTISATDGGEDYGYREWCADTGRVRVDVKPYPRVKRFLLMLDCRGRADGQALQVLLTRMWRLRYHDLQQFDPNDPNNFVVGPFTLKSLPKRIGEVLVLVTDPSLLGRWRAEAGANGGVWKAPMPLGGQTSTALPPAKPSNFWDEVPA